MIPGGYFSADWKNEEDTVKQNKRRHSKMAELMKNGDQDIKLRWYFKEQEVIHYSNCIDNSKMIKN